MGLIQHYGRFRPIVFLSPTSSRIHLQRRHASYRCAKPLPAKAGTITNEELGFFTRRKAGTWDRFSYFPSEGRHTEDFPDDRKIQRLRPGLNPRTRVPVASMLTTRPPKPSMGWKVQGSKLVGFLFSIPAQTSLGHTETPEKSVSLFFPDGKPAHARRLPPTPFYRHYTSTSPSAPAWNVTEKPLPLTSR